MKENKWFLRTKILSVAVLLLIIPTGRLVNAPNEEKAQIEIAPKMEDTMMYEPTVEVIEPTAPQEKEYVSRGNRIDKTNLTRIEMRATAYDLSVQSTGKSRSHPAYGITKSGERATKGRTVAVDRKVIPLRSTLYVDFPVEYDHLDGIYVAEDIGGAIDGNEIDIFFGEDNPGETIVHQQALEFGVRQVIVYIIEKGE